MFLPQIRRLRIEIEKLQWLHQQELSEMKHNLGKFPASKNVSPHLLRVDVVLNQSLYEYLINTDFFFVCFFFLLFTPGTSFKLVLFCLTCRTDNGRDEAESGAGERTVGGWSEKADRVWKAAGSGRDQKETVVRQLQERSHLLLLLEYKLLWLPLPASPLARTHEVLHTVR